MAAGTLKFSWKIKDFSSIQAKLIDSDVFSLGSYKWNIRAYPKGNKVVNHLSLFLRVADSETLPFSWSRNAKFSLTVIDQINSSSSVTDGGEYKFDEESKSWGWASFIPLQKLHDPEKGFLVEDSCIIEAEVTVCEDTSVESSRKEPTEEDMNVFFGDLNSVIFPVKVVSSEEEAKQALEVIEEALNMAPEDLNNQGRMVQLKNTFDVLSSLDDCSILTSEQKAKLLSMRENFIKLPERAANAVKGIKLFTEKELVKKSLDQKLAKCLIGFEKGKVETVQNEQNIATLLAQIGEMEKKKDNLLLKQKEMFKVSKESKGELDKLVKNWPEDEAKMKAAKEEKKFVGTEWSKMKQFVLSLKPQSTLAIESSKKELSLKPQSTLATECSKKEDIRTVFLRLKSVFLEKKFYLRKKQRIWKC